MYILSQVTLNPLHATLHYLTFRNCPVELHISNPQTCSSVELPSLNYTSSSSSSSSRNSPLLQTGGLWTGNPDHFCGCHWLDCRGKCHSEKHQGISFPASSPYPLPFRSHNCPVLPGTVLSLTVPGREIVDASRADEGQKPETAVQGLHTPFFWHCSCTLVFMHTHTLVDLNYYDDWQ